MIVVFYGPAPSPEPGAATYFSPNLSRAHYIKQWGDSGFTNRWLLSAGPNFINLDETKTNVVWAKHNTVSNSVSGTIDGGLTLPLIRSIPIPWSSLSSDCRVFYRSQFSSSSASAPSFESAASAAADTVVIELPEGFVSFEDYGVQTGLAVGAALLLVGFVAIGSVWRKFMYGPGESSL